MNKFPECGQNDLVLTASVNWSGDAVQIIDDAERDFDDMNPDGDGLGADELLLTKSMLNDSATAKTANSLNESWGNYFAKKSPPMGDLNGSHGIDPPERPHFCKPESDLGAITEEKMEEEFASSLSPKEMEPENEMKEPLDERMEPGLDDMVMINMESVHKSTATLTLSDLHIDYDSMTNRDSNSTQKTSGSTDSQRSNRVIHVPRLKHIQRFYQFKVTEHAARGDVEAVLEGLMAAFIESHYGPEEGVTANVVATSFKRDSLECTLLVVFDETDSRREQRRRSGDNEQWMDRFLAFGPIQAILDLSVEPHFTELTAS